MVINDDDGSGDDNNGGNDDDKEITYKQCTVLSSVLQYLILLPLLPLLFYH